LNYSFALILILFI
jgi:hypothetical protein